MNANDIFVFGSNLAGRHGAGSAKEARLYWRAEYGIGVGRTGNAYAIPTKDRNLKVLPLESIAKYIKDFCDYAHNNAHLNFRVVDIGCGLAGYTAKEVGPLFTSVPDNVIFIGELDKWVIR